MQFSGVAALLVAASVLLSAAELQIQRQPEFFLTHVPVGSLFPNLAHKQVANDKEKVTFEDEEAGASVPQNAPYPASTNLALSSSKPVEDQQHKIWEQEIKQQQQLEQQRQKAAAAAAAKSTKSLVHTGSVVTGAASSANVMWWAQPMAAATTTAAPPPRVTYPKGWNACLKYVNYLKAMKVTGLALIRNIQATCNPSVRRGTALEKYKQMCDNIGAAVEPFAVTESYDTFKVCDAVLGIFHGTTAGGAYVQK